MKKVTQKSAMGRDEIRIESGLEEVGMYDLESTII